MLLDVAGQDATEAFEDVGHSDEARETLAKLLVGSLKRKVREAWLRVQNADRLHFFSFDHVKLTGFFSPTAARRPHSQGYTAQRWRCGPVERWRL